MILLATQGQRNDQTREIIPRGIALQISGATIWR